MMRALSQSWVVVTGSEGLQCAPNSSPETIRTKSPGVKEQNVLSAGCESAGHTWGQGSDLAPCKILSLDLKSLALRAFLHLGLSGECPRRWI